MKDDTKDMIERMILYFGVLIVICAMFFILYHSVIIPAKQSIDERNNMIEKQFKEADYNLSDDYEIIWTTHSLRPDQWQNTSWYYWKATIYNVHYPFYHDVVTLWHNIETNESYIVGNIPPLGDDL